MKVTKKSNFRSKILTTCKRKVKVIYMSLQYVKDVLIEELDRKKRAKNAFETRLKEQYAFTQMKIKVISGKEYIYAYSSNEKKDIYIGKNTKERKQKMQEFIDMRHQLLEELKSVKSDIHILEKMINMI